MSVSTNGSLSVNQHGYLYSELLAIRNFLSGPRDVPCKQGLLYMYMNNSLEMNTELLKP